MAYESMRPRKAGARAAAAAAAAKAASADAGGPRAGHGRWAAAGMPPPPPPAEPGGRAPRYATQLANVASMAYALPTKVLRFAVEGEELRAASTQHRGTVEELRSRLLAAEISAEQSKHAARDAKPKLYHHRYNVRKRKHGADEEDCEAGDESGSESAEGGGNSAMCPAFAGAPTKRAPRMMPRHQPLKPSTGLFSFAIVPRGLSSAATLLTYCDQRTTPDAAEWDGNIKTELPGCGSTVTDDEATGESMVVAYFTCNTPVESRASVLKAPPEYTAWHEGILGQHYMNGTTPPLNALCTEVEDVCGVNPTGGRVRRAFALTKASSKSIRHNATAVTAAAKAADAAAADMDEEEEEAELPRPP
eukprot:jgi/Tetstr1/442750/TSEL_030839.t1